MTINDDEKKQEACASALLAMPLIDRLLGCLTSGRYCPNCKFNCPLSSAPTVPNEKKETKKEERGTNEK